MALAFDYVKAPNNLMLEADYRYTARDGTCKYDASKGVGTVSSYINVAPNSE